MSSDSDGPPNEPLANVFAGFFEDPESAEEAEENDWAALMEKTEKPAEFGADLPADLAVAVERVSTLQPDNDKVKAWKQKYLVPGNAKKLSAPVRFNSRKLDRGY